MAEPAPNYVLNTFRASDGYRFHYRHYAPPPNTKALAQVICLHGIQSHGGWYEYSCMRMSQAGFEVYFLDRRGSGLNRRNRGDTPSFRRLVEDVAEFIPSISGNRAPTFLVGISWGGKTASALACRRPDLVEGVVLICPGFFPRLTPWMRRRAQMAHLVRALFPKHRIDIPLNNPALFTASPRWQEFLRQDRLALHQASARFLAASLHFDRYLQHVPKRFHVPVLLLLAENDRIIDTRATRRFVNRFETKDRTLIMYPGAHHTLEFEPDLERFVTDLIGWLQAHLISIPPPGPRKITDP